MSRINLEYPIIENPTIKGAIKYGVTSLPGTANATLDMDMGPVITITPTAARVFTLPIVTADMRGQSLTIVNGAAFTVTVNNFAGTPVAIIPATVGATGTIVCTGEPPVALGWTGGL